MKIAIAALNAKYVHSNLAVYDLQAYACQNFIKDFGSPEDIDIVVKEYTINNNLDSIMRSLYKEKADVVAFSCYIWNISEILMICRDLKKISPETDIWLGGPEVSYDSEKLLEKYGFIDGVVCGEGEATFYEIVKTYYENRKDIVVEKLHDILGITYRKSEGRIEKTASRPLLSMDDIPFIYEDLKKFDNKILYYESSRGCPFSCSYCLSSIDKKVRFRNLSLVKKELSFFMRNKVRQVKFIDRTFNCDRKRARQIWSYIQENDNGVTNYHFEIAADLIEDEDISIFRKMRPGLIQLEIGLQSTNNMTISEIRRVMDIDKVKSNMLAIRKAGNIHQHLDLIAGLPFEDYESFIRSFNMAYQMKPNQLQLGFLKVLKGSYMEEQVKEYGLIYSEYEPYEVLATKWISYDEILKLKQVEEMVEVYYNSDQFEHVLVYLETFFATPFEMFGSLGEYYENNALFGIGLKREKRYEILRTFFIDNIESAGMAKNIFDDLLTFDYYCRENAKNRPSWSIDIPISKQEYNDFFKNGGTEEMSLISDDYDSKQAARAMHIEPVNAGAIKWIMRDTDNAVYAKDNKAPDSCTTGDNDLRYVVYDYDRRDPLSGDADYTIITHL